MPNVICGDRIARQGRLVLGCAAVVRDLAGEGLLLVRREDDGRWNLPGGQMSAGESAAEACAREVLEETGVRIGVERLVGIYSDPHRLYEYPNGDRVHSVMLCFEARVLEGEPRRSDETSQVGYFSLGELASMDVLEQHRECIRDSQAAQEAAFIR
jgi:ADP-ribose pyrophosphatase YjhB (NUDIX family)